MAIYSIGDLEKLSGIKAHTIRMWEQRYGIFRPRRSENNSRTYDDDDLRLLTQIASLNRQGWRISKIAGMSREAIAAEVSRLSQVKLELENQWDVLTLAVVEMDEIKFSRLFDEQVQRQGFERAMQEMGFPFLEKLNLLLLTGSVKPVQGRFMQRLLRQKIIAAIEKTPLPTDRSAIKFLLCSPGEGQDTNLLFWHYLLRMRKLQVVDLGENAAVEDLKMACGIHLPDYVFCLLPENFNGDLLPIQLEKWGAFAPESKLVIVGNVAAAPAGSLVLKNTEAALIFLNDLTSP